jgi:hypothetical protein
MRVDNAPLYRTEPAALHRDAVREIFWDTLILGKPLQGILDNQDSYEELSIGWYLLPDNTGSTVVIDNTTDDVVGYALVCTRPDDYAQWLRFQAWRVLRRNIFTFCSGRMSKLGRQFYSRRLLDSFTVVRSRQQHDSSSVAHVHMNLRSKNRTGSVALALLTHVDTVCQDSGMTAWVGEVNATEGTRMRALERLVGEVIDTKRNRTASFFSGLIVNRLTVRRSLF